MSIKENLPATYGSEAEKKRELFELGNARTSIPAGTWVSSTSAVPYVHSGGNDLYVKLTDTLETYAITAGDFNKKADRYHGSATFPPGSSDTITHAECTSSTIVRIYPQETTPGDKLGAWEVYSSNGSFMVASHKVETKNIPYIWEFLTGGE